jgi:hypothetical protein
MYLSGEQNTYSLANAIGEYAAVIIAKDLGGSI